MLTKELSLSLSLSLPPLGTLHFAQLPGLMLRARQLLNGKLLPFCTQFGRNSATAESGPAPDSGQLLPTAHIYFKCFLANKKKKGHKIIQILNLKRISNILKRHTGEWFQCELALTSAKFQQLKSLISQSILTILAESHEKTISRQKAFLWGIGLRAQWSREKLNDSLSLT